MSRSGYSEDCDGWALIRWRGAVTSAIKGTRGQQLLREMAAALDAMPDKRLVSGELEEDGEFCALGVLGAQRGLNLDAIDPEDPECVANAFDIAPALASEIVFENDEVVGEWRTVEHEICGPMRPHWPDFGSRIRRTSVYDESAPARRWRHVRAWVESKIIKEIP